MAIISLLIFLAILTVLNYRFSRSVLYPPFVFCAMWLLVFSLFQANLIEVDPLHIGTIFLIGTGALLFSVSGAVAYLFPRRLVEVRIRIGDSLNGFRRDSPLKYVLLAAFFLGMIASAHHLVAAGARGTGATILARARAAGVESQNEGASSLSLLTYAPVWSTLLATLFLIEKRNRLFWMMAGIAFALAILTTGRVPILQLFCALIAVHLIQTHRLRLGAALRFVRLPLAFFFSLYVLLIFTNKDTSSLSGGVGGIIVYFVVSYIIGPVAALDQVLQHPADYTGLSNHTFKFPLQIASSLHLLQYTPPPLLDSFVTVPFPTNVYTGYKFFFTDFGLVGCLAAVTLIGFLHTLLYRKAISGSALGLFVFAFMMMPLVMFIFDDLYTAMGEEVNMILVGCVWMLVRRARLLPARKNRSPRVADYGQSTPEWG